MDYSLSLKKLRKKFYVTYFIIFCVCDYYFRVLSCDPNITGTYTNNPFQVYKANMKATQLGATRRVVVPVKQKILKHGAQSRKICI